MVKSFRLTGFLVANPINKSRMGKGFAPSFLPSFLPSFRMKTSHFLDFQPSKLLLILLFVSGTAFGQFDLYLTGGAG